VIDLAFQPSFLSFCYLRALNINFCHTTNLRIFCLRLIGVVFFSKDDTNDFISLSSQPLAQATATHNQNITLMLPGSRGLCRNWQTAQAKICHGLFKAEA